MEAEILAIFIPIILTLSTAVIFYLYLSNRNKERMALIEKATDHNDLKLLFTKRQPTEPSANRVAKWGIIFISIGLAVICGVLLEPYVGETITFGLVVLFIGLGLLVYYSKFKDAVIDLSSDKQ